MPRNGRASRCWSTLALVLCALVLAGVSVADDPAEKPGDDARRLAMTAPVACAKIDGYQLYEPLPDATVSKDDKLLVYFEPLNFTIERSGKEFTAHLVQDVRVRKRGTKAVLWSKDALADYQPKSPTPQITIFLHNRIGLKGLGPGDYDMDIILHDELAKNSTPARQTLQFTVKASPTTEPAKDDEGAGEDEPANKAKPKKKPRKK